MHRSHKSVLFVFNSRRGVARECSQQRNSTGALDKRMITYIQQKLAGKHIKRFVCYKRWKFKGTGEARAKQICIAFHCVAKEGVKWREGGFK